GSSSERSASSESGSCLNSVVWEASLRDESCPSACTESGSRESGKRWRGRIIEHPLLPVRPPSSWARLARSLNGSFPLGCAAGLRLSNPAPGGGRKQG